MSDLEDFSAEEAEYDALEGEACTIDGENEGELHDTPLDAPANVTESAVTERVSADIAGKIPTWRGVRSCNSGSRAEAAARPVAQAWVNATIAANPDREVVTASYYGRWNYRNETTGSGRRKCKGWWSTCTAYVDFA